MNRKRNLAVQACQVNTGPVFRGSVDFSLQEHIDAIKHYIQLLKEMELKKRESEDQMDKINQELNLYRFSTQIKPVITKIEEAIQDLQLNLQLANNELYKEESMIAEDILNEFDLDSLEQELASTEQLLNPTLAPATSSSVNRSSQPQASRDSPAPAPL
jgi:hypothetical protein